MDLGWALNPRRSYKRKAEVDVRHTDTQGRGHMKTEGEVKVMLP